MDKIRLDALMVQRGLANSREQAKSYILAGRVFVDGIRSDKVGTKVPEAADVVYKGSSLPYVSRGGLKLHRALEVFGLDLTDRVMADIGASTGGFSDCALQHGVKKVFAVDVGYGQLAWALRNDPRVVCMERTNARHLSREMIGEVIDFATIDVSFISLALLLPTLRTLFEDRGEAVALIKPQFEAGREAVGKKGVVKDPAIHDSVIRSVVAASLNANFFPVGLTYSPITGPEGNIEYLLHLRLNTPGEGFDMESIEKVVREAHSILRG